MRIVQPILKDWTFRKGQDEAVQVSLPHCYNAVDGQDGSPMYRGEGTYTKTWTLTEAEAGKTHYLEVGAAALCAEVRVNGVLCYEGKCGYAMFRVKLEPNVHVGENTIEIKAMNPINNRVYPAMADFSFYGGVYRNVSIITDDDVHFCELDGSRDGIILEPTVEADGTGRLRVTASVCAEKGEIEGEFRVAVVDAAGAVVACASSPAAACCTAELTLPGVHLWNGVADPYLYTTVVTLCDPAGSETDERRLSTGFRTIGYDAERGFLLNGKPCQLRGVARHQDFGGVGNAVTRAELETDLRLILEVGANSVRSSHYQHCDDWYELCDRAGLLVWAEVPVISAVPQKADADANAMQQLDLLIAQARNHCSVYCWGVQNETCMISNNPYTWDLARRLAERCKQLDPSRMTAQANEYTTDNDCPILQHTDILGFNLYYGWYYGQIEELQGRLDAIHAANPGKPIILTEYGVDTNPRFHSLEPKANDYSEEYQLKFIGNAIRAISERSWMAGGYVWNMFDFGSAGRDEGGKKGQNQKGLITIDRQTKKDAFFLYKANWSAEPFVYAAGRRFVNRAQEATDITVLSNMQRLTLTVNGVPVAEKIVEGASTVFAQIALLPGENTVRVTGVNADGISCEDVICICRVAEPDASYVLPKKKTSGANAVNWFIGLDPDTMGQVEKKPLRPEGFTFDDTIDDIFCNEAAKAVFLKYFTPITKGNRFDPHSLMSANTLFGFMRGMNIPDSLKIKCEQEMNEIDR